MIKVLPFALAAALGLAPCARAVNPIVQTMYTTDPAPVVHDGTLYVFTGHDEDQLVKNFFTMKDWRCFSTTDLVNWTDHGAVATLKNLKWADGPGSAGFENGAWAPQAIERGGKWYLYVPLQGRGIGVLVADNPSGPYTDPIGKPLIERKFDSIDPTVFIDDDGQAYLYWGNPCLWHAKLNKDMISYDTSVGDHGLVKEPMTVEAWGERSKPDKKGRFATSYEEGPWLYKRNGLYYMFFAGGPISEHIGYSTGKTAEGPWKYGGVVMPTQRGSAFTNHPGIVDYQGKTYLFYHSAGLPGGGGFHRSVCMDELKFNPDGSVVQMNMTKEGPAPVATLNPYQRVEAATIAWETGVKTESADDKVGNMAVTDVDDGGFIQIKNVDFGSPGARGFAASVSSTTQEKAAIELHLDRADGPLVGTLPIADTGGQWKVASTSVTGISATHDLFFVFKGDSAGKFLKFDWWKFTR